MKADNPDRNRPDQPKQPRRFEPMRDRLALGIERLGLIPLRFPFLATVLLIVIAAAAVFGVRQIKIDDSLSQLFRSDTAEFKQYEEVTRRFPSSEFDVLIVVEGKQLLERNSIEKLRNCLLYTSPSPRDS